MPTDLFGVRPLGSLSRHPADWFSDYCYVGGYNQPQIEPPLGTFYVAVSLFNNDDQGRVAKVYGMSVEADTGEGVYQFFAKSPPGSRVGAARSIRPDFPDSQVSIYQSTTAFVSPNLNPYLPANPSGLIATSGYDGWTVMSPFPLFIIPVGWALVSTNLIDSGPTGTYFWFQMASR